jgi:4-amino-4-deoxy-L-arabinose transferase-like glycosyltransferase
MYSPDRAIPILNQIFLILTAALVFGLGLRHFDGRVAWVALMSFVATQLVWEFSLTGLSTSLLMFLVTALIFCALEIYAVGEACTEDIDRSFLLAWVWALLLGLLLAAACLTRLSLLCLILPLAILLARMPRANYLLIFFVVIIAIGAVCPWYWHLYKVSGNPFGSTMTTLLYGEENYTDNQIYRTASIPSYQSLLSDAPGKEYTGFRWHLEHAWGLLGCNPLILLFAASILHRFKRPKVLVLHWFLIGSSALIVAVISLGVNKPEALDQLNTVVVLFPCMLVIGSAFFFLLLDRLELQSWILDCLVAAALLFVNALPMLLTLTNPPNQPLPPARHPRHHPIRPAR